MSFDPRAYYKKGSWNVYCQVCAKKQKSDRIRRRWDGLYVCPEDWEPRHPQDFLRAIKETSNMLPFSFDDDGAKAILQNNPICTLANSVCVCGVGAVGCFPVGRGPGVYGG